MSRTTMAECIRQLERLNQSLRAEVDRMRPVVEAVTEWAKIGGAGGAAVWEAPLMDAIDAYHQASQPK